MINKRSLIALSVGIFVGFYLFQSFLLTQFIGDIITTFEFSFAVDFDVRLENDAIATAITILIIILIDPKVIFIEKVKKE